jgi:hemoglobin-like flavoprotein
MTQQTKTLIRDSFELAKEVRAPLALLFYGRLFEIDPSLRPMFHTDLKAQGLKLIATLEAVVNALDNLDAIRPKLEELGRKHVDYGVRPEHYDKLTAALLWALSQALAPSFFPKHKAAWRDLMDRVSEAMKAGGYVPR